MLRILGMKLIKGHQMKETTHSLLDDLYICKLYLVLYRDQRNYNAHAGIYIYIIII